MRIAHGMGARTVIAVNVVRHSSELLEVMRDYPDLILSDYLPARASIVRIAAGGPGDFSTPWILCGVLA